MRLIDADEYKDYIIDSLEGYKLLTNEYRDFARDIIRGFLKDIDAQPTAYDIDKVVKRLEDHAIEFEAFGICSDYVELSHAIKIVKGGTE